MTCHVYLSSLDFPDVAAGEEGSVEKKVIDHILPVAGAQMGTAHSKTGNILTGCNEFDADLTDRFHPPLPKRDIKGNDKRLIARLLYVDLVQGPVTKK